MLISSSRSGQWIPWPAPISRQLRLSAGVACTSLGYQANGTEMVRPSERSAIRASSVTSKSLASGNELVNLFFEHAEDFVIRELADELGAALEVDEVGGAPKP